LPGCGDQAPRAIAGRWCSRTPEVIRRRGRTACRQLCWCPV
jgi:hypothetical protein